MLLLSVHPSCAQFFTGDVRMVLKPNLSLVPKVVRSCSPIDLAFTAALDRWSMQYAAMWTGPGVSAISSLSLVLVPTSANLSQSIALPTGWWR